MQLAAFTPAVVAVALRFLRDVLRVAVTALVLVVGAAGLSPATAAPRPAGLSPAPHPAVDTLTLAGARFTDGRTIAPPAAGPSEARGADPTLAGRSTPSPAVGPLAADLDVAVGPAARHGEALPAAGPAAPGRGAAARRGPPAA